MDEAFIANDERDRVDDVAAEDSADPSGSVVEVEWAVALPPRKESIMLLLDSCGVVILLFDEDDTGRVRPLRSVSLESCSSS